MSRSQKQAETTMEAALEKFFSDVSKTQALAKSIAEIVKKDFEKILETYEIRINTLEKENNNLKRKLDNIEQHNRRNTLRIFGIKETENENVPEIVCDVINKQMELNIPQTNIEECYRIKNRKNEGESVKRDPAIIVKFSNYQDRRAMYTNKLKLKGSKIVVREDLTKRKLMLVNKSIDKYGRKNVWTSDGKIKVKTESGRIFIVSDECDI